MGNEIQATKEYWMNEKCVIVYDDSDFTKEELQKNKSGFKTDQGRFWWKTCAKVLNPVRPDVDKSLPVFSLEDWGKKLKDYLGSRDSIYWLEFWGHGSSGRFCIGDKSYDSDDFIRVMSNYGITKSKFCDHLKRSLTAKFNDPVIWFRTCRTGMDESFLRKIATHFEVYCHSHTKKVGYNAEWPGMIRCTPEGRISRGGKSSLFRPVDF